MTFAINLGKITFMDAISKGILSVIAVALCAIAFKLYSPNAVSFVGAPTRGDFQALKDITDPEQRREAHLRLVKSIPLVRVEGGQIDVSGSVSIDGAVTIDN